MFSLSGIVSQQSDIFWRSCQIWLPLNNDFELWIEETPVSVTLEDLNKQGLKKWKATPMKVKEGSF